MFIVCGITLFSGRPSVMLAAVAILCLVPSSQGRQHHGVFIPETIFNLLARILLERKPLPHPRLLTLGHCPCGRDCAQLDSFSFIYWFSGSCDQIECFAGFDLGLYHYELMDLNLCFNLLIVSVLFNRHIIPALF